MIGSRTPGRQRRMLVLQSSSNDHSVGPKRMTEASLVTSANCSHPILDQFFRDCGGNSSYQLAVTNGESKEMEILPLSRPFRLVGRSTDCDIVLKHWDVSYRHCYLQMLGGRVLCVDLDSRSGVRWNEERRKSGWLMPGKEVFLGQHSLRLVKGTNGSRHHDDADVSIRDVLKTDSGSFPKASLELLSLNSRSRTGKLMVLKPGVTLVGRSRHAQVRLKHDSVSQIHTSLVLTQTGLWAVDLLGRNGTLVNGQSIEFARLQRGDELAIGEFHMVVEFSLSTPPASGVRQVLRHSASTNGDSSLLGADSSVLSGVNHFDPSNQSSSSSNISPAAANSATEEGENDASGSRWTGIIDALKSGGFGS